MKILITLLALSLALAVSAQDLPERHLTITTQLKEPVKISNLTYQGKVIDLVKGFTAEEDWIKGIEFDITNTSAQAINYLEVKISIPETPEYPSVELTFNSFGQNTTLATNDSTISIKPGAVVHVTCWEKLPIMLKEVRDELKITAINHASLVTGTVIFENDTMWKKGREFVRDKKDPNRWNRVQS